MAKFTHTGYVGINKFNAAGKADFEGYEYVNEKAPKDEEMKGFISASYDVGTALISYYKDYKVASVKYITKEDGTAKLMTFMINPDHPNFKENYAKTNVTATDLRLNEIMAVVNNPKRTKEDVDRLNSSEFPYLLMFISGDVAPGQYNIGEDYLGRPKEWPYKTSKKWIVPENPQRKTDTLSLKLGNYNGHINGLWVTGLQYYLINENGKYIDLEGKEVDKQEVIIGGMSLVLVNIVQGVTKETIHYYRALKGSVIVRYVDTNDEEIARSVIDIENAKHGADYDTEIDNKPLAIKYPAGTYKFVRVKEDPASAKPIGKVVGGKQLVVTYVYDVMPLVIGSVVVKYEDTEGNAIGKPVFDEEDKDDKTPYDTKDKKLDKIEYNGNTYKYKEVKKDSVPEEGKIEGGKALEVTYVYELVKKGSVKVNYVDKEGNVIKEPVFDEKDINEDEPYDTKDKKDQEIKYNGKTYRFVEHKKGSKPEIGKIVGGEVLEVTYVYELVSESPNINKPSNPNNGNVGKDGKIVGKKIPKTEDNSNMVGYLIIMMISGLALFALRKGMN